jgi:hypothetical protein
MFFMLIGNHVLKERHFFVIQYNIVWKIDITLRYAELNTWNFRDHVYWAVDSS